MTVNLIADSIVNLCGAIGLCVALVALHRRDPRGPLTKRLVVMLGIVAILFFTRGIAWWTGSILLDRLSLIPAALVPFGTLIVTEGILRRHAPRIVKIIAVVGAILIGLGGALGLEGYTTPYAMMLALFQLAGFAVCAWLLGTRDRTTLLASENRSIGRVAFGALFVMPFVVTDFQALVPNIPVRLGALGSLLVVTVVLIAGGGYDTRRQDIVLMALRLSSAALLGVAAACVSQDVDAAQIMRLSAIAISGVLTIGLLSDTLRADSEFRIPGVLDFVAASAVTTREDLIAELARHPIFESARRYRESELAAYDPRSLCDLLSIRQVLRLPEVPWGLTAFDPAVERVLSLMKANDATHVIVLSHDPVDLLVLAVPVILTDPATETALALVRRLLAQAPEVA